ncbi:MAG TPA: zinc ABC transporter substrate-binding protein [Stellaceae bacterium]|nr:zinc ABC transporter substrate-binding protein [Stellaceae bacterium]
MRRLFLAVLLFGLGAVAAHAAPLSIVAAENFYGDVAQQIGGPWVAVTSILTNPDEDPHLFEASPSTARNLAAARIVVYNGAAYDDWMAKLLAASPSAHRDAIEAAALMHKKPGDNPHLWYDPATMPVVADALAARLRQADPAHRDAYDKNLAAFRASLAPLAAKVAALRGRYRGVPVTATEPVFGYMADAIGLAMRNARFQLAIMNDTEPGASDIAAFENDLKARRVRVLLYNSQASDAATLKMQALAKSVGIPVVGVSETEPPGTRYQDWMMAQLAALDRALTGTRP